MNIIYRKATIDDLHSVTELMLHLYEDATYEGLLSENRALLNDNDSALFLAVADEKAAGFSHCTLRRDYVEGTNGGPVGYLEGIYVVPEYRSHAIAESLLRLCEAWARKRGCREFASDCRLNNTGSIDFHLKSGFKEANRLVCFVKQL